MNLGEFDLDEPYVKYTPVQRQGWGGVELSIINGNGALKNNAPGVWATKRFQDGSTDNKKSPPRRTRRWLFHWITPEFMAERTGLKPAPPGVTGWWQKSIITPFWDTFPIPKF